MNSRVLPASCRQTYRRNALPARCRQHLHRAVAFVRGSWSRWMRRSERELSMDRTPSSHPAPPVYLFSGSGCRAATTPPRLRDAEAAGPRSDSSTRMSDGRLVESVASAAQARAAAERLARSARFAGSLCAAGRGATRRSATSSTTLNRYAVPTPCRISRGYNAPFTRCSALPPKPRMDGEEENGGFLAGQLVEKTDLPR